MAGCDLTRLERAWLEQVMTDEELRKRIAIDPMAGAMDRGRSRV